MYFSIWILANIFWGCLGMLVYGISAFSLFKEKRVLPLLLKISLLILILVLAIVASNANNYFFQFNKLIGLTVNIGLATAVCLVLCNTKLYLAVLFGTSILLLLEAAGLLIAFIIRKIFIAFIDSSQVTNFSLINTWGTFSINLIVLFLCYVVVRFKNRTAEKTQLKMAIGLSVFMVLTFIFIIYTDLNTMGRQDSHESIIGYSVIFIVYGGILTFALTKSIMQQNYTDKQLAATEELLVMQKEHINQISQKQAQIQQMSHDFKQNIHTLQGLSASGDLKKIDEVLHILSQQQSNGVRITATGNAMIDALLSIKREIAERESILCDWNTVIPSQLINQELDICVVLGNALDNAIEACRKSAAEQPFIKLDMYIETNWLLCGITNPIGQIPKIERGTFLTSKTDVEQHGLGVQSMKRCCEDMGGNLEIFYDEERFTVRFMLPLNVVGA